MDIAALLAEDEEMRVLLALTPAELAALEEEAERQYAIGPRVEERTRQIEVKDHTQACRDAKWSAYEDDDDSYEYDEYDEYDETHNAPCDCPMTTIDVDASEPSGWPEETRAGIQEGFAAYSKLRHLEQFHGPDALEFMQRRKRRREYMNDVIAGLMVMDAGWTVTSALPLGPVPPRPKAQVRRACVRREHPKGSV